MCARADEDSWRFRGAMGPASVRSECQTQTAEGRMGETPSTEENRLDDVDGNFGADLHIGVFREPPA